MKTMFYPGAHGMTGQAFVGIAVRHEGMIARTDIIVINSSRLGPATSLVNTDAGRDILLNKILATDLQGVRTEFVRFFVLYDGGKPHPMHGLELPIRLDFADYKKNGNPYEGPSLLQRLLYRAGFGQLTFSYWSGHVLGGCAKFYTDFEERRHVPEEEMNELCAAVGYQHKRKGIPDSVKNLFSDSHPV